MSAVVQLIAGAAPGDAVTDQAIRLRALLRDWGHPSEIVADHVHPALRGDVHRLDAGGRRLVDAADAVVLRYSIWSEAAAVGLRPGRPLAVVYHNITPPEHLRHANPEVAAMCERGREHLAELVARADVVVADSAFNAAEVRALGGPPVAVVPLLLDAPEPSPPRPALAEPRLLTVGRIVPNKRIEDVVRVHELVRRSRSRDARLTVVGSDSGFERYGAALRTHVQRLGASGIEFTGRVPDERRDRAYREASVYLCMSVHEGFCAPLVEAMRHGVPIVARAMAAVPETVGAAGLLIGDEEDLAVFAEAAWEVSTSEPLRRQLAAAAGERLRALHPDRTAAALRTALRPVVGGAA